MLRYADMPDSQLLALTVSGDRCAFGEFYRRRRALVTGFLVAQTSQPEVAADLTGETFAAALEMARDYRGEGSAVRWLLGIARNKLRAARRRGRVEDVARRRLGFSTIAYCEDDLVLVMERADWLRNMPTADRLIGLLSPDQQEAVRQKVLDELEYPNIAKNLGCSEFVARSRVSRGLRVVAEEIGRANRRRHREA